MLKFIVLADTHIVPEGKHSHGLDTYDRLKRSVAHVNAAHSDAAFVIFAGDLADHGEAAAYRRFQAAIAPLTPPVHLTLGNHDHRPTFLQIFGDVANAETSCLDHVIDADGHRVIILDSYEEGLGAAGRIDPTQLSWLSARLSEAQDRPVIVVLHHNVTPLHVQTDFIILRDRDALLEVLRQHPDIRQVISGHVHMTTSGHVSGIPFCSFAGGHYNIEPVLEALSGPVPPLVPRREGPAQMAVVLCDASSTVVHFENTIDANAIMSPDLFHWVPEEEPT
ncbi:MAG: metallophosphoesterase [Pseudomonadota bacterium]